MRQSESENNSLLQMYFRRSRLKRFFLSGLLLFVLIFIISFVLERSPLSFYNYHIYYNEVHKDTKVIKTSENTSDFAATHTSSNTKSTAGFQSFGYKYSFSFAFGDYKKNEDIKNGYITDNIQSYFSNDLKNVLKEQLSPVNSLQGEIIKAEKSRLHWTPLIKYGAVNYETNIKGEFRGIIFSDNFSGEVNFECFGICPVSELNREISKRISQQIVTSINKDIENK